MTIQKKSSNIASNEYENIYSTEEEFANKIRNAKNQTQKIKAQKFEDNFTKFLTQEKPPLMDVKEWERVKMTENKVLNPMKKALRTQHITPKDVIKLVKTNYGLKYKPYSKKMAELVNKLETINKDFNEMIQE